MLSNIIEHLHSGLESTGYFEKIIPLAKLISRGQQVYPAYYCENGEFEPVSNFDSYNGLAYIRMNGKQRFVNASDRDWPGCDVDVQVDFPLRIVACVPKSKLTKDDAYSDERVSRTLIGALTKKGGELKRSIRASDYLSFPESVDFDSRSVLREEYQNVEKMQEINYKYSYHAIDLNVMVKIKASCITTECNEEYYSSY